MDRIDMGVTQALSAFVAHSNFAAIPDVVRHEGRRAFVNWMGCVFGGCNTDPVNTALPLLDTFSGPREATVIGRGVRLDIFGAAFLNSMSNASRSYNDTHLRTVAHPTASVAAALISMVERQPVSGDEFLHALILGVEVQCRVGNILMTSPARCHFAASMIGLVGGIGAAIAVAKLLGFEEQRTLYALGLAAAQAGGIRATHGSMGGRMLSGEAARAGLFSAMLAERGFTTSAEIFEGPKGFANAHAESADANVAITGLGTDYEILSNTYKPYPCGIVVHPVIDVCLDLVREHQFHPSDIERVDLLIHESAMALTGRKDPTDSAKAGTSLYHWAAASLIYRVAGLAQGADSCVLDPGVIALRNRVTAAVDLSVTPVGAKANILLKNGTILSGSVDHARGSLMRPLTDEELSEKFLNQAKLIMNETAAQDALVRCWELEGAKDVRHQLLPLLHCKAEIAG